MIAAGRKAPSMHALLPLPWDPEIPEIAADTPEEVAAALEVAQQNYDRIRARKAEQ